MNGVFPDEIYRVIYGLIDQEDTRTLGRVRCVSQVFYKCPPNLDLEHSKLLLQWYGKITFEDAYAHRFNGCKALLLRPDSDIFRAMVRYCHVQNLDYGHSSDFLCREMKTHGINLTYEFVHDKFDACIICSTDSKIPPDTIPTNSTGAEIQELSKHVDNIKVDSELLSTVSVLYDFLDHNAWPSVIFSDYISALSIPQIIKIYSIIAPRFSTHEYDISAILYKLSENETFEFLRRIPETSTTPWLVYHILKEFPHRTDDLCQIAFMACLSYSGDLGGIWLFNRAVQVNRGKKLTISAQGFAQLQFLTYSRYYTEADCVGLFEILSDSLDKLYTIPFFRPALSIKISAVEAVEILIWEIKSVGWKMIRRIGVLWDVITKLENGKQALYNFLTCPHFEPEILGQFLIVQDSLRALLKNTLLYSKQTTGIIHPKLQAISAYINAYQGI